MATALQTDRWNRTIFIDGEFVEASPGKTLPVTEKATGRELGVAGVATTEDVDRAVAAAGRVQRSWAKTAYDERAAVIRRAAQILADRGEEVVDWIVRETGSIPGKAQYEVNAGINELHEAAGLTSRASAEILPSHVPARMSIIQRLPVGVVGVITPWNFPVVLGLRVLAPALALGNAVILKPSPNTPYTGGLMLAEIFADAGLPAGLLEVVVGDSDVGEHMVAHPGIHMIHFTGSSETGSVIAETAGRLLKKTSMEMGGNNAFVVLDDADIEAASMVGAWSAYHYQGQTCITASRHIVMRSVADAYVEQLAERARRIKVGDPTQDGIGLGPMISERQRDRGHSIVQRTIEAGAQAVEGAEYDGLFYRPTVLTDVRPGMEAFDREIFAPVAPITVVDSEEEALELTNATPYGLVNAVYTGDLDRGLAFAEQVRSGMVHVNDATCLDEAHVPFGGMGASGMGGRSGGEANLEEFTERRWLTLQRGAVHYPY